MKRFLRSFGVVAVVCLVGVASASATTTAPPTVSASDLTPVLYAVGAALLAAVLVILAPVFLTKVPFAIVNIVNKAIHRLMGRSKPVAG